MHPIYSLSQQLKEKEVGPKAYQLSCVFKTFNVPPAFVLTKAHLEYFLQPINSKINELLKSMQHADEESIQSNANKIQELIVSTQFANDLKYQILEFYSSLDIQKELDRMIEKQNSPLVAVRPSSFVPSDSSCHFSLLNVKGENELFDAIKICWASLFTKKSIELHLDKGIPFSMGVIIHKMVSADLSGDAFFEGDKICVRGVYGLGEAMQKNMVQPDVYLLRKESLEIIQRSIAEQDIKLVTSHNDKTATIELSTREARSPKLKDKHITEAALLCKRVANFLKEEIDCIEFCIRDDMLYLVQVDLPNKDVGTKNVGTKDVGNKYGENLEQHNDSDVNDISKTEASTDTSGAVQKSSPNILNDNSNDGHEDYSINVEEKGDSLYIGDENHLYNPEDDLFDRNEKMQVISTMSGNSSKLVYGAYNVSSQNADSRKDNHAVDKNVNKNVDKDTPKKNMKNEDDSENDDHEDKYKHDEVEEADSDIEKDSEANSEASEDEKSYLTEDEQKEYKNARDGYYADREKTFKEHYCDDGVYNIENLDESQNVENASGNKKEDSSDNVDMVEDEDGDADLNLSNLNADDESEEEHENTEEHEKMNLHVDKGDLSEGELYVHEEMLLNGRHFILSCFELINKKLRDFHYTKTKYEGDLEFAKLAEDLRDYIEDKYELIELYEIYSKIKKNDENPQLAEISAAAHTTQGFINTFPKH